MAAAPTFKPFTLALVQLGQIGANKAGKPVVQYLHWRDPSLNHFHAANLQHAREMVLKAASGGPNGKKPNLIVLPVCPYTLEKQSV